MTRWDRCLRSREEAQIALLLPWIPTLQKMGQSLCCLPRPGGWGKEKATFCGRMPSFKMKHLTLEGFRIFFSVSSVSKKKTNLCTDLCSPFLPPCPSSSSLHRLSASIRPSTHRRSLSKRSMQGISSYCLCESVWEEEVCSSGFPRVAWGSC